MYIKLHKLVLLVQLIGYNDQLKIVSTDTHKTLIYFNHFQNSY